MTDQWQQGQSDSETQAQAHSQPMPSAPHVTPLAPPAKPRRAPHSGAVLFTALLPPALAVFGVWLFMTGPVATSGPESFIGRLFDPVGPAILGAVPQATLALFFWLMVDLLIRGLTLVKSGQQLAMLQRDIPASQLQPAQLADSIGAAEASEWQRLFAPMSDGHPLTETVTLFQQRMDLESGRAEGRYTIPHLFIWAMPILGFIGTVLGIGIAVGGFSGFLKSDIDDIEVVKAGLAGVASGLSFAFDTTLLGLAGSLIGMLLTTLLQRQERNLLSEAGALGLEIAQRLVVSTPMRQAPVALENSDMASHLLSLFAGYHQEMEAQWKDGAVALASAMQPFIAASQAMSAGAQQDAAALQQCAAQLAKVIDAASAAASLREIHSAQLIDHSAALAAQMLAQQSTLSETIERLDRIAVAQDLTNGSIRELVLQSEKTGRLAERFADGLHVRLVAP